MSLQPGCQKAEATFHALVVCNHGVWQSSKLGSLALGRPHAEASILPPEASSTAQILLPTQDQPGARPKAVGTLQPLTSWKVEIAKVKSESSLGMLYYKPEFS